MLLTLLVHILAGGIITDRLPPTGDREADDLVVACFNIRYGTAGDGEDHWSLRRPRCLAAVVALDADLLGLQEALAFQIAEIDAALPGFTIVGVGRDDGAARGEHCPIVVRDARFEIIEHGTFWLSDTPEVPGSRSDGNEITRICTWALLRGRDDGRTIRLLNAHLDHRSAESRKRAAERLRDRLAAWPPSDATIVLGDFNAPPDSPPLEVLLTPITPIIPIAPVTPVTNSTDDAVAPSPIVLRDSWRLAHPDAVEREGPKGPEGTFHAFRGHATGARIDYILVCEALTVRAAAIDRRPVDGRWPSDHFPIAARVRWAPPPPALDTTAPSPSASAD